MEQSSWSLVGVVFVVVEVLLEAFDLPFLVGPILVELFSSIVGGSSLDKPVGEKNSAAVSAVTTEAAVLFLGEVQKSLVYVM